MESARILITEDDASTRSVMRILLQSDGHLVAEAANGAEAMDVLCAEDPPDLVLLDLSMPGVDGYEFLEALAAMTPRPATRVVVVTADHTPGLAADLADLGAAGLVYKPLRREDLWRIVEKVLGQNAIATPPTLQSAMEPIHASRVAMQDHEKTH